MYIYHIFFHKLFIARARMYLHFCFFCSVLQFTARKKSSSVRTTTVSIRTACRATNTGSATTTSPSWRRAATGWRSTTPTPSTWKKTAITCTTWTAARDPNWVRTRWTFRMNSVYTYLLLFWLKTNHYGAVPLLKFLPFDLYPMSN